MGVGCNLVNILGLQSIDEKCSLFCKYQNDIHLEAVSLYHYLLVFHIQYEYAIKLILENFLYSILVAIQPHL